MNYSKLQTESQFFIKNRTSSKPMPWFFGGTQLNWKPEINSADP